MNKKIMFIDRIAFKLSFMILLILIAYWQVGTFGFNVLDDYDYVAKNEHVRTGLTFNNVIWAFQPVSEVGNWHPITWLSHMLDVEIYGLEPRGHHITNLIIHILNSLLLLFVFNKLTKQSWPSYFVCLLFALHPLHIESVAWISERKDLLCTMFFFLTIISYRSYVATCGRRFYLLTVFYYLMALMSKPMAVTLPFVLLLLDYWPLERMDAKCGITPSINIKLVYEKIPLFIMSIMVSLITFLVQQEGGAVSNLNEISLIDRLSNALISYAMYLWKTVWPEKLSIFYPYQQNVNIALSVSALIFLMFVTINVFRYAFKRKYIPAGWLWYVGMMVPVIGLVQVGSQSMADRYTYLPLIGIFVMIAWGIDTALANKKWQYYTKMLILLFTSFVLTTITSHQLRYWEENVKLMKRSVEISGGNNHYSHYLLGLAYLGEKQIKNAEKEFNISLQIAPKHIESYVKIAEIHRKNGACDDAKNMYINAIRLDPYDYEAMNGLGNIYQEEGRFDEAIRAYYKCITIQPKKTSARVNLAIALYRKGEIAKAENILNNILESNPNDINAWNQLAILKMKEGKMKDAYDYLLKAIKNDPTDNDVKNNIGVLFLLTGSTDLALKMYQDVLMHDETNIEANYLTGVAYMKMMNKERAKFFLYKVIGLDKKNKKAHYALALILLDEGNRTASMRHMEMYMKMEKYNDKQRKEITEKLY